MNGNPGTGYSARRRADCTDFANNRQRVRSFASYRASTNLSMDGPVIMVSMIVAKMAVRWSIIITVSIGAVIAITMRIGRRHRGRSWHGIACSARDASRGQSGNSNRNKQLVHAPSSNFADPDKPEPQVLAALTSWVRAARLERQGRVA
jgi:hypothetical protein